MLWAPGSNPGLLLLPCGEAPERHGPPASPGLPGQAAPAPGTPQHPRGQGRAGVPRLPPYFTPAIPALTFAGAFISQSGICVWEPFPETVNMPER